MTAVLLLASAAMAAVAAAGILHPFGRRGRGAAIEPLADPLEDERDLLLMTLRELEVARLVGTGRRTRDVAGALKVSPRTIEVHLSRIYRKSYYFIRIIWIHFKPSIIYLLAI